MRYFGVIILVLLCVIVPVPLLAQGMDIVEIDVDSGILYFLYHYEPKLLMGQIFGSFDFNQVGYTLGIYFANKSFSIEFPVGALYSAHAPISFTHWKMKVNWFAAFPSFQNPTWEFLSINDFSWGRNGSPNMSFTRFDVLYRPIDMGPRLQCFRVQPEGFSPYLGIQKRVRIGGNVAFHMFQGRRLNSPDWFAQVTVMLTHFGK